MKILLIFVLVLVNPALFAPQRPLSNALSNCKENGIEYEQGAKIIQTILANIVSALEMVKKFALLRKVNAGHGTCPLKMND